MRNKIINRKVRYTSPYFDKFKTIDLVDFIESNKDLLISEISIDNKFLLRIFYSNEEEKFCFESSINNKRIQYVVLNKIDINNLHTERELNRILSNLLDFIANSSGTTNVSYMELKKDIELMDLIRIYNLASLESIYSLDLYLINKSYICFYYNLFSNEIDFIVINKNKFENSMMKYTPDYECKYTIKKDENILNYLNQAMNEISQKSVNDIKELLLYLL